MVVQATRRSSCSKANAVLSFLNPEYQCIGPVQGVEPATSRCADQHSTDWAIPAVVKDALMS